MESGFGKKRVETAAQRMNEAVVRASGLRPDHEPDEPASKRSRESFADDDAGTSGGGEGSAPLATPTAEPQTTTITEADRMLRKRKPSGEGDDIGRGDLPENTPTSVRAAILGKGDKTRPAEQRFMIGRRDARRKRPLVKRTRHRLDRPQRKWKQMQAH